LNRTNGFDAQNEGKVGWLVDRGRFAFPSDYVRMLESSSFRV